MYRCVVLAYDGSREGRSALREGALLARRLGSEIHLLCVVPASAGIRAETAFSGAVSDTVGNYRSLFDEALAKLRELGCAPQGCIVMGEPTREIAGYARQVQADLVVVGHRRMNLVERWWSGETGAYLVDHLDCSLLIARQVISDDTFAAEVGAVATDTNTAH